MRKAVFLKVQCIIYHEFVCSTPTEGSILGMCDLIRYSLDVLGHQIDRPFEQIKLPVEITTLTSISLCATMVRPIAGLTRCTNPNSLGGSSRLLGCMKMTGREDLSYPNTNWPPLVLCCTINAYYSSHVAIATIITMISTP